MCASSFYNRLVVQIPCAGRWHIFGWPVIIGLFRGTALVFLYYFDMAYNFLIKTI